MVYIVTVPETAYLFLRGQFRVLQTNGYEICLISSPGPKLDAIERELAIKTYPIEIKREISLVSDLISLLRIFIIMRELKPTVVNYSTPKAGLLGAIAAWLAHIPIRIYELRGLRLETVVGLRRFILASSERITSYCSTYVVCVSKSLLSIYKTMKLARPDKVIVFRKGTHYSASPSAILNQHANPAVAETLSRNLNIAEGAKVIGYVGRLTRDKGIEDLFKCFLDVVSHEPKSILLIVGKIERGDPLPTGMIERIRDHPDVRLIGEVEDVAPYYQIMDVFAFPSYREGLPNAPLEAALAGVPTVGYGATGVVDAVVDGETGILIQIGCVNKLTEGILRLLKDDNLRRSFGKNAREYVLSEFSTESARLAWLQFYEQCLSRLP